MNEFETKAKLKEVFEKADLPPGFNILLPQMIMNTELAACSDKQLGAALLQLVKEGFFQVIMSARSLSG